MNLEPDMRPSAELTTTELCNLIARRLHINGGSGQVTIELVYDNGILRRAHTRTGPISPDQLNRLRESAA